MPCPYGVRRFSHGINRPCRIGSGYNAVTLYPTVVIDHCHRRNHTDLSALGVITCSRLIETFKDLIQKNMSRRWKGLRQTQKRNVRTHTMAVDLTFYILYSFFLWYQVWMQYKETFRSRKNDENRAENSDESDMPRRARR